MKAHVRWSHMQKRGLPPFVSARKAKPTDLLTDNKQEGKPGQCASGENNYSDVLVFVNRLTSDDQQAFPYRCLGVGVFFGSGGV